MADDKKSRNKQADDEERRQRERELQEARDRADEPEPVDAEASEQLGDLDVEFDEHGYPTTAGELIETYGDREIDTQRGSNTVAEVLAPVDDDESYDSADDVRQRILGLVHR